MRTNTKEYIALIGEIPIKLPLLWRVLHRCRFLKKQFVLVDDFDWTKYHTHYRAEISTTTRYFTIDLRQIDFRFLDGKIYILGDCKPLNPTHRCVLEAVANLPTLRSAAEVGMGAGYYLIGLRQLLGEELHLTGYDLNPKQLEFFCELYPREAKSIGSGLLDITRNAISSASRPDVAFASTVLMHIQRPDAYKQALRNFLLSGNRFAVLMDNWAVHDYWSNLNALISTDEFHGGRLYSYDSGGNVAIVMSRSEELAAPYHPLTEAILKKYL